MGVLSLQVVVLQIFQLPGLSGTSQTLVKSLADLFESHWMNTQGYKDQMLTFSVDHALLVAKFGGATGFLYLHDIESKQMSGMRR